MYKKDSLYREYPLETINKILMGIPFYLPEDDDREGLYKAIKRRSKYELLDFKDSDIQELSSFLIFRLELIMGFKTRSSQKQWEEKWKLKEKPEDDTSFLLDICAEPYSFRGDYMVERYRRIRDYLSTPPFKSNGTPEENNIIETAWEQEVADFWDTVSEKWQSNYIVSLLLEIIEGLLVYEQTESKPRGLISKVQAYNKLEELPDRAKYPERYDTDFEPDSAIGSMVHNFTVKDLENEMNRAKPLASGIRDLPMKRTVVIVDTNLLKELQTNVPDNRSRKLLDLFVGEPLTVKRDDALAHFVSTDAFQGAKKELSVKIKDIAIINEFKNKHDRRTVEYYTIEKI